MVKLQNTMNFFPHWQILVKTNASGSAKCGGKKNV